MSPSPSRGEKAMTLKSEVDQVFLANIESANIRYTVQPVAAPTALVSDGAAAAWAWAAYVQIVAAGVIPNPCWLIGISLHTGVIETFQGDIAIARGAAAAEVDLAMFHIIAEVGTITPADGISVSVPPLLLYPIKIAGSPRLACRLRKSTGASAAGVSLKVILASAVGS